MIAEFGAESGWSPEPSSRRSIHLQARIHPSESWTDIVSFDWWTPPSRETMSQYITYANAATKPTIASDQAARGIAAGSDGLSTNGRDGRWQNNRNMTIFFATVTVFAALLVVLLVVRKNRQS